MILISLLDAHASSSLKTYSNEKELAKRNDLYTGDDFYFGFDSSNQSFLDIIGGKKPLAIKYGQTLCLYKQSLEGYSCTIYCIDPKERKLVPIISISAKPEDAFVFQKILPWSFTDFYLDRTQPTEKLESAKSNTAHSEYRIQDVIEKIITGQWPSDKRLEKLNSAILDLHSQCSNLKITVHDLKQVKELLHPEVPISDETNFITPHSPFHNNARLTIDFIKNQFPNQITVRFIEDGYPRIEIIAPGLENDSSYTAVYKSTSPRLYEQFKSSLSKPEELTSLLKEEFADMVDEFLLKQCSPQTRESQPSSKMLQLR